MKKVFRIMVAGILLFSGMHFSLDSHYCGGNLVNIRLSFAGESGSCGMEKSRYDCEVHYGFDRKCCEDKVSLLGSDSEYLPEYTQVNYQPASKKITGNLLSYPAPGKKGDSMPDQWVMPPGKSYWSGKSHTELCVFRT